jgi:hypothetical protein
LRGWREWIAAPQCAVRISGPETAARRNKLSVPTIDRASILGQNKILLSQLMIDKSLCRSHTMIWRHSLHGSQYALVLAATCFSTIPQQALAAVVHAYAIFEIAPSADVNMTAQKLTGTSLGNCKPIFVGTKLRDVILLIDCDESSANTNYLSQAMADLSKVDGVSRATLVAVKQATS